MLVAHGLTAQESGALLGVYSLVGLPLTLVVPALAGRRSHQTRDAAVVTALLTVGYTGLALAPGPALLWTVMVGAGAGGAHGLALMLIIARAPTEGYAVRLAGMAQTVGYLVAAAGPVGVGLLHAVSGGWELPLLVLAALGLPTLLFGIRAGRPTYANQSMVES
jgi:CP family cyanate transporter-like MFS transporter